MNNKLYLIAKASKSAPHKRQIEKAEKPVNPTVKMIRQNQSFYIGDTLDIVSRMKKGALSKAIQKSLRLAFDKGELKEFLEDE